MSYYDSKTVLEILLHFLRGGQKKIPHGARSSLAAALGCHPSYLAQVLAGRASLSQEQAMTFARHSQLNADQTEFLLATLNLERAGTEDLRKFYERKLDEVLSRQGATGRHLSSSRLANKDNEATFFSNWTYQAIHAALQISALKTAADIANFLRLPKDVIEAGLAKLQSFGMAKNVGSRWTSLLPLVHFHGEDYFVRQRFHMAWRFKALESCFTSGESPPSDGFSFSSLLTLDESAQKDIVQELRLLIKKTGANIKDVPSERLCAFNIDVFRI